FTVLIVFVIAIWGKRSSPFVQFLHFSQGVGGCIVPLLANPFLAPTKYVDIENNGTYSNMSNASSGPDNASMVVETTETNFLINENNDITESSVKYAYLIVAVYYGVVGLLFFLIAIKMKTIRALRQDAKTLNNEQPTESTKAPLNKRYRVKMLFLVTLIFYAHGGVQITLNGLITTFSVEGLQWTKYLGTSIASVSGVAITLSCLLGTFATKILSQSQMISIQLLIMLLSMVTMVVFVQMHSYVLWVTVIFTGLSSGSMNASIYSWLQENVMPVTGIVVSCSMVGKSVSAMTVPLLAAALMENVHFMWFTYLLLGIVVLLGVIAICIYASFKVHMNNQNAQCAVVT
ncbi:unnamed protein product, partial [Owenia fusiformis]